MLSLATQTNSTPLPSVPEAYGVRLPPPAEGLPAVDFGLAPAHPPPGVQLFDEEIEEVEESESDDDMEPAPLPPSLSRAPPAPAPRDVDMLAPPALALAPDLELRPPIQPQELLRRADPAFSSSCC